MSDRVNGKAPRPPKGLSRVSCAWWRRIHEGWLLDDSARFLLEVALRAVGRRDGALDLVTAEGLVVASGRGQRAHPALAIVKDAEQVLLKAWRQLGLDVEAPSHRIGRPPGR